MTINEADELRRQTWDAMSEECYDCPHYIGHISNSEMGDQIVSETLYECAAECNPFLCPVVRGIGHVAIA